jgi:hypothetical protein
VQEASKRGVALQGTPGRLPKVYKRDFWSEENLKDSEPHIRLEKSAQIVNKIAECHECHLFDLGFGPAALRQALQPNIHRCGDYIGKGQVQKPADICDVLTADGKFVASHVNYGHRDPQ